MKQFLCCIYLGMVVAGCADDSTGALAYTVDFSNSYDGIHQVQVSLAGLNRDVFARVTGGASVQGILDEIPAGRYMVSVSLYAEGVSSAAASVSQVVGIRPNKTEILDFLFAPDTVESIAVSNNTPRIGETVTLTANTLGESSPRLVWSDDCAGDFASNTGFEVQWSSSESGDCNIAVQSIAQKAEAVTAWIRVGLAKGTHVLLAGTGECLGHTYAEHDDGTTRVSSEVWFNNGYYIDQQGMDARSVGFDRLTGVALDPNKRVVFADRNGGRILRIEANGTLTRLAGTARPHGSRGDSSGPATQDTNVYWPHQLEVAPDGDIYFAEAWGRRIKKVYADAGTIATWAGNGGYESGVYFGVPPTSEEIGGYNVSLGLDSRGNTYFGTVGWSYFRVYKVYASGYTMSTILSNVSPWDIEVHAGKIYLSERFRHRISRASLEGESFETLVGSEYKPGFNGDGQPGQATLIHGPRGLFVASNGDVYFADTGNNRIRVLREDGSVETVLGNAGVVSDFVIDGNGDMVAARHDTCSIEKIIGPF